MKTPSIYILSQAVRDEQTRGAIRQVERLLGDVYSDLTALDARVVETTAASGVSSVTAGSSKVTVSPTTGAVVVDVVPANFTGIPQSGITGLVADLSAINTAISGLITEVIAGTNLSGGGTSGSVTLNVVASPSFTGVTLTSMTPGSVLFAGAGGLVSQDNAGLFWDDTNNTLTITSPTTTALGAKSNGTSAGTMFIQNTNVAGPSDFYATDNAGTAKVSWGYGNASYSDTARQGRAYLWRNTGVDLVFARTGVVDGVIKSDGKFGVGTSTSPGAQLDVNGATPDVYINGTVSGLLRFSTAGFGVPTFSTRSVGAKLVLYPELGASNVDYGLGIAGGTLWYSVPQATGAYKHAWYGGTTEVAALTGAGNLSVTGALSCNGNATLGNASSDSHTANGILNVQNLRGKVQTVTTTGVATVTINDDTTILRFNPASLLEVIGFTGGADGRIILCENIGAANTLLYNENAGATAVNRIRVDANGGSVSMYHGGVPGLGVLWYDGTTQRWKYGPIFGFNTPAGLTVNGSLGVTASASVTGNLTVSSDASVTGNLAVQGNTALGNDSSDTVTVLGRGTVTDTPTAATPSPERLATTVTAGGTYDCTASGRFAIGIHGEATATRSAGAIALVNIGGRFTATGAQVNRALQTVSGDVQLNTSSGETWAFKSFKFGADDTHVHSGTGQLGLLWSPSAGTATGTTLTSGASGTFDTTAGALENRGLVSTATGVRTSGASNLTNVAVYASASGGQFNYALQTGAGDNYLNQSSGATGIGAVPHTYGNAKLTVATSSGYSVLTRSSATAATSPSVPLFAEDASTYNTTSAAIYAIAVYGKANGTRSSGANNVNNVGLYGYAALGQANYAVLADVGDVMLNFTSGVTTIKGATTVQNTLSVTGNATLGDASTDTHTLNGNLTLSNAPTAGSLKVGSVNARVFLGQQIFTTSGTYTPTTGTKAVRVRMVGGGGGGGGAGGGSTVRCAGGGGSSGVYWEKWIDPAATVTGGTVTIGAAGSAGSSSGGTGGNGGDTSVVIQGTTYTAKGGTGNAGLTISDNYTTSVPPQAGSTAGWDVISGGAGTAALAHTGGTNVICGNGGSNPLGIGGVNTNGDSAGVAGTGYGAGGSGGYHVSTTDRAGGAGTAGVIIIEEYA